MFKKQNSSLPSLWLITYSASSLLIYWSSSCQLLLINNYIFLECSFQAQEFEHEESIVQESTEQVEFPVFFYFD
ncbi:hypothetical protein RDI58_027319 [Solanum bulbocastanum]|uniref:Uncharacterized protein n=1 Tax=Solanum bulbocastanum TaxID=147425 RepID=A0AAN8T265_SOLBU